MSEECNDAPESECAVCYTAHDEEIHQATVSIHQWFHAQVTHEFAEEERYYAEAV